MVRQRHLGDAACGTRRLVPGVVTPDWEPADCACSCYLAAEQVFVLYWALLYSPGDEVHAISVVTHGVQPPRLARLSGWLLTPLGSVNRRQLCRDAARLPDLPAAPLPRAHHHVTRLLARTHPGLASSGQRALTVDRPLAYSLSYLVFSAIYYAAGGTYHRDRTSRYIYDVLDWSVR